jgi:Xaa-Pro aminopeptidase
MDCFKKYKNKFIILYSGFHNYEKVSKIDIYPNFYYLTKIYIPNIIFIYFKEKIFIYIDANKNEDVKIIEDKIKSIYQSKFPKSIKIKFISLTNIRDLLLKNTYQLLTLKNIDKINNILSFPLNDINSNILEDYCFTNRQIKTQEEIEYIKKACYETSKGIRKTIKELGNKKYKKCYDIVNSINCNLSEQNLTEHSYPPICSVGRSNILLHNPSYEGLLKKGDVLLLDIGFKYKGYCADITRTYCIKNRFTKNQKIIYDIVLKVNKYCISQIKDSLDYNNLEDKCYIMITELLDKKKLFNNEMNYNEKIIMGKKFMPHRLSHNLGIETHDCGNLNILKENMVITIEPGIYFNDILLLDPNINQVELKKYYNIGGIRIEDVILVKKEGYKVLSNLAK